MAHHPVRRHFSSLVFLILCSAFCLLWSDSAKAQGDKKIILCSTTQIADFARQIVGDRCVVKCVLSAGEDPHTYEPGGNDLQDCAKADLCLQNGWNLEGNAWMQRIAVENNKKLITCIDGVKPRVLEGHGEEEGMEIKDPHAWFKPSNALIYVNNIRDAVCELEPEYADEFRMRADMYRLQLLALDRWIKQSLSQVKQNRRVLISHHDAFGYFCDTYKFVAESPVGWTTGELTELSLSGRQELVKYIRERGVPTIFVETSTNNELLTGIAKDAGIQIGQPLYSDAMGPKGSAGETYLGMMRENVLRIIAGLGESSASKK
ncbi:metal ABC transporter substrate-binding protein [Mariniblastus fucicola]|uniref:Manganese ABC transporter substrate-binding lipoprotein n=1 Tax=Mariniblastus fucicola TaxID=980251 RepID=A0A5B9P6T4_9BACT|nr:metal ABC transporter substrate-binding protein [Mariniblastus fucicola]QEG21249.1 Manganese ABC transporter substrate-binding lipoprotein precursor [Mariniblastus fucicola]